VAIIPLVIVAAKLCGLYDRDELLIHKTTAEEVPAIFQLATVATLATWLLDGPLVAGDLAKTQILALWVLLSVFLIGGRWTVRRIAEHVGDPERCLLIGPALSYDRLSAKLVDQGAKAEIVARVEPSSGPRTDFKALREIVDELDVHRVILVPDHANPDGILDLVRAAKGLKIRVTVVPGVLEVVGSTVAFDNIGGMPLLGVRPFGLSRSSRLIKRSFDLAVSGAALLIASPLLVVIAIAIRLDSRGPVFFRQTRVGRDGEHFGIFKFRTMVPEAEQLRQELEHLNEAHGIFKIEDDPRITRVGRFLRHASLDELPQLFNVFLGDMSVVGPRPLIVDEDSRITGFDRRRLQLTPGMTGHWQILGSARVPLAEMVKIDYLYVAGWSLWTDVKLLLRTIPYVLARRGQ
jgi:exopolysaccharide biosynthesis polyprenyl glycosylphosphotransferase